MVQIKYLFLGSGLNSRLPEIWLPETISSQMFFKTHQQKCWNSPPYQPSPLFTSSTLFFLFVFVLWGCSCRFFVDVFFILMFPIVLKELEKWVYFRHLGHTDTCQTIVTSFKYRHRKSKRKESVFFLSEFSFTNIHDSQDTEGRRRLSFKSTLPLSPVSQTLKHQPGD